MNDCNISFYIPTSIDVQEILKKEKKKDRYIECQIDKYHWFLNALYLRSMLNKKYDVGDFIPMNSHYMNKTLGSRYAEDIKKFFIKHGVIECDNDAEIGVKSYGYRLSAAYKGTHYNILADSNSTFIQSLQSAPAKAVAKMDDITRYTYFHLNDLDIYCTAAEQYVQNWYEQNYLVENPKLVKRLKKKNQKRRRSENKAAKKGKIVKYPPLTYHAMLDIMRDSYLYQIRALDEMLWLPQRDNKGRRIHSCLTNIWKELRQFLYLKNKPDTQLVSIDCSNSQPFTLIKIILEYFHGSSEMPEDVHHYIKLVCTGKLYQFMCHELGVTDPDEIATFKVDMFAKVFYCENEKSIYTPEATKFIKFFPTVYQIIMAEKKLNYKQLSIEMQRVETKAMVDGVLTDLMKKYGDKVWFNTIHDAVLCPAAYEAEVRSLMLHHYALVVGATPHIKPAEKVNTVMAVAAYACDELPDLTPLDELKQRFDTLFSSAAYKDTVACKQPKMEPTARERKVVVKRGIDW